MRFVNAKAIFLYNGLVGIWESILPWRFGHGQCKPKGTGSIWTKAINYASKP